jgi:hypothetical protein
VGKAERGGREGEREMGGGVVMVFWLEGEGNRLNRQKRERERDSLVGLSLQMFLLAWACFTRIAVLLTDPTIVYSILILCSEFNLLS